jgi:DNA-directed RNA polymerase specialized sigma24 family protein
MLAPYVQQELQIRERDELLNDGLTPADVLDETLLRAWDRFSKRDPGISVELWLVQLVDQVLEESSDAVAGQSLDDEQVSGAGTWVGSDQDEWVEQATYPEALDLAELLPGDGGVDAWDALDTDVKQARLAEILGGMPRERRQAFVLNVAHGYNATEIADFQSRSVDQVKGDIVQATAEVRRAVTEGNAPDLQERFDRAKGRDRETRYPRRR